MDKNFSNFSNYIHIYSEWSAKSIPFFKLCTHTTMQLVIQNIYIYLFLCSTCILTWFFRIWELPALSFPGTSKTIWTKFSHFLVWSCQPAIAYCLPANRCWPLSSDTRIMISKWRLYVHQPALLLSSCHALLKLSSLNPT